jgi:hypothetical protein
LVIQGGIFDLPLAATRSRRERNSMKQNESRRSVSRSVGAVMGAFFAVAAVSLAVDSVLHAIGVYPGWTERMTDAQFALATAYRILFGIAGGYLAAWWAPSRPTAHALALGVLGTVLSISGAVAAWEMEMGPAWYSIALVVTALPTAWAGGALWLRRAAAA